MVLEPKNMAASTPNSFALGSTAESRDARNEVEVPQFSGSVYLKKGSGKWKARHVMYNRNVLYEYKNLHQESLLDKLDIKRVEKQTYRDDDCPVDYEAVRVGSWCIAALTEDEMGLWHKAMSTTSTQYFLREINVPDIRNLTLEQQQQQLQKMHQQIDKMNDWMSHLEVAGENIEDYAQYLEVLADSTKRFENDMRNPPAPLPKQVEYVPAVNMWAQQIAALDPCAAAIAESVEQSIAAQLTPEEAAVRNLLRNGHSPDRIRESLRKLGKMLSLEELIIDWTTELGAGSFGRVYQGKLNKTIDVAVKVTKVSFEAMSSNSRRALLREVYTLSQCDHPNLLKFYGLVEVSNAYGIVTERVNGMDLESLVKKFVIPPKEALKILTDIASAMAYLHSRNIKHRDLKPANVLIDTNTGTAKVCDFGMASAPMPAPTGTDNVNMTERVYYGTPIYAAPELPSLNHTFKVDVYSFALIAWFVWTRREPFSKTHGGAEQHFASIQAGSRETLDPKCPWNSIIERCWDTDASKRLEFTQVVEQLTALQSESTGNSNGKAE